MHENLTASAHEKAIASVDPGGDGWIDVEDQQSTFTCNFKRFNLIFLYVGIKTVYITLYN